MPRKPNYRFERFERERTRAAKKAARAQAKADKKAKPSEVASDQAGAAEGATEWTEDPRNSTSPGSPRPMRRRVVVWTVASP